MFYRVILSIVFFLCMLTQSIATEFYTNLNTAKVIAQQNNQQILLVFSADYCKFCNLLKEEILLTNAVDHLVVCVLDTETNRQLSRKFKIRTLPTSIILDTDGQETSRISGYNNQTYIDWLSNM